MTKDLESIDYNYTLLDSLDDCSIQPVTIRISKLEEDSYVSLKSVSGDEFDDIVLTPQQAWALRDTIDEHIGKAAFKKP